MKNLLFYGLLFFYSGLWSQDLDSLMRDMVPEQENDLVMSTFKSPKLVLLQTNETQPKQTLTFWIFHRFGDIGGEFGGSHTLFGLDNASDIRIAFDYGITEAFTLGVGRSRFNESYDLQGKLRLLRQRTEGTPVALTLFAQSSWITRKETFDNEFQEEADRISHFLQLIVARKFSPSLSLMLNPGYLIRSQAVDAQDQESFFILGMGGRLKLTKRLSLIADYTIVNGLDRPDDLETEYFNPLGIGLEIETGGHVFSLNFQNAPYIAENNFIPYTQESWSDGGVRFGFSISRNFYLGPKKAKGPDW